MELFQQRSYSGLRPHERDLADLLFDSREEFEILPFRVDARVSDAVIVAAECRQDPSKPILVVAPAEFVDSWAERWDVVGDVPVEGFAPPEAPGVVFACPEQLREHLWHAPDYSTVLFGGGLSEDDVNFVTGTFIADRFWRLVAQPESYSWTLHAAGRSLYHNDDAPTVFKPEPRLRLSALTGRVLVTV